jgi:copper chaperone CopZ
MTKYYRTNMRCQSCLDKVRPFLDAEPSIRHWHADLSGPDKTIMVEGTDISRERVNAALEKAGYKVLGEVPASPPAIPPEEPAQPKTSYYPLLLILAYLLGVIGLVEATAGTFDPGRAMRHFMAGFFLVFSFFKLLNLSAFADAYSTYDVLARRSRTYAQAYPFIELLLGAAYLVNFEPTVTNVVTLVVMGVSTVGVVQSLFQKRKIRCACLGTVFNLPMSVVTLTEDLLMVAMAAAMLLSVTH